MAEPMRSANAVVPFPEKRIRRRDHELAFLPAALEIVETPPSPIGRAIGATIIAVFVLAIAWACLGTVDIVATAPGKIIPSGRSKVIQPFETGVVRAIQGHDGGDNRQDRGADPLTAGAGRCAQDAVRSRDRLEAALSADPAAAD